MTDTKQISSSEVRKLFIKQQMEKQRQALKLQSQPLLKTGQRVMGLFSPTNKEQHSGGKIAIVTGLAIVLAVLGKRRGGWLGKAARFIIINYPGLLHKLIK